MIARHIETIFCDDIRLEIGGKLSLIGVYSGTLFVRTFPVILPKLCLLIKTVAPADEPFRTLKLRVLKDDETLQEVDVDPALLATRVDAPGALSNEHRKIGVQITQFNLVFSPLQFDGPCTLRVRVQAEDEEQEPP